MAGPALSGQVLCVTGLPVSLRTQLAEFTAAGEPGGLAMVLPRLRRSIGAPGKGSVGSAGLFGIATMEPGALWLDSRPWIPAG